MTRGGDCVKKIFLYGKECPAAHAKIVNFIYTLLPRVYLNLTLPELNVCQTILMDSE